MKIGKKYHCIKQHDIKDCGAACLATISKQYGLKIPIVISILMVRGSNIAIFIGMAATVVVGMIFGLIDVPTSIISMPPSMAPTFGVALQNIGNIFNPQMILVIFTFLFMDFFDTAGTLVAVGSKIGLLKKDGSS